MRVVIGDLLTGLGSRGFLARQAQRVGIRLMRRFFFFDRMGWHVYRRADALAMLTSWEAKLMQQIFGASPERVHVIPNGVEEVFFQSQEEATRSRWLICTATITHRKRVLELARGAVRAGTPLWVIGKPYSETDPYYRTFLELVTTHSSVLQYTGGISNRGEMAKIYRRARGFVLLSTMESLSLSALEAAACNCPLLLSDLPWARTTFGDAASYCPKRLNTPVLAHHLRKFYDSAHIQPSPPQPVSWKQVGEKLHGLYEQVLNTSR